MWPKVWSPITQNQFTVCFEIIIISALRWTEWRGRSLASLELWREVTATQALRENWSPLLFELSYELLYEFFSKQIFKNTIHHHCYNSPEGKLVSLVRTSSIKH